MNFGINQAYSPSKENRENEKFSYSTSPYSSSLPSPPYSEDGIGSSDEEGSSESKNNHKIKENSVITKNEKGVSHASQSWFRNAENTQKKKTEPKNKNIGLPKLKQIYPNLYKNFGQLTPDPSTSNKSPEKGKPRKNVKCCVCYKKVRYREFKNHLYFGSISCSACGASPKNCIDFVSFKSAPCCSKRKFKWDGNPVQYLKDNLLKNDVQVPENDFKNALSDYINSLHSIEHCKPYSQAINKCKTFIDSNKRKRYDSSDLHDYEYPVPETTSPDEKRKVEPIENIDLPIDGFYLVVTEPIEECPNCYETLNPDALTFNLTTWLITAKCEECHLIIYLVLNPPDGTEPKIKILKGE